MTQSLRTLPNFVDDAYLFLPQTPFVPENIVVGTYTFLPWVRGGVGAVVDPPDGGLRASLDIAVPVHAADRPDLAATASVLVRGPGDVLGIDDKQIVRRYPVPGTLNAEDSFLCHVEFDRPDVPWMFSPAAPQGERLTPWVALVVLADGRYTTAAGSGDGLPPQVSTFLGELQPTDAPWAWAHAQLVGPAAGAPTVADRLTPSYAAANLSRLLCPRRLRADTSYLACVVPLYNAGVAVGLDQPAPDSLAMAWTRAADGSDADVAITLPVYNSWKFATGDAGDFASLAERLRGAAAPWQVGRRLMQTSSPRGGLPDLAADGAGRLQTVLGPLHSPNAPSGASQNAVEVAAAAAETAQWPGTETEALRGRLARAAALAGTTAAPGAPIPRPVVGPELYARYQAGERQVDPARDADWFGQLNLQPRHRVVAGVAARVVQKDQEQLMTAAWAQVGQIDAVNRSLRWAQLARFVGASSHARHIAPLGLGDVLPVSRRVHSRVVSPGTNSTVAAVLAASNTADAAAGSAFRRLTRPLGALAAAAQPAALARLVADGDQLRDFQRPYQELNGVTTLADATLTGLDFQRVSSALGTDPTAAAGQLAAAGTALAAPAAPDLTRRQVTAEPNLAGYVPDAGKTLLTALNSVAPTRLPRSPLWQLSTGGIVAALHTLPGLSHITLNPVLTEQLAIGVGHPLPEPPIGIGKPPPGGGVFHPPPGGGVELPPGVGVFRPPPPKPATPLMRLLEVAGAASPQRIGAAFTGIGADLVTTEWPGTPVRPPAGIGAADLVGLLDPVMHLTARIKARLGTFPAWLRPTWFDDGLLTPVMAAPVFTRPMYQALDAYSRDWLLSGLDDLPQPDVVTLLVSNAEFVEAFLAGLSHEMGRELLWRGYPTDERGTYFRRFWSSASDELAQDLAFFTPTALGTHVASDLDGRVVLLVRGELIRRYPNAVVLAMYAGRLDAGVPVFEDPSAVADPTTVLANIAFHRFLAPDMVLVGFDLTVAQIQSAAHGDGRGWWFVIAEHPTAPRFGLGEATIVPTLARSDLGWDLMDPESTGFLPASPQRTIADTGDPGAPTATFGLDAAHTARVLLRDPFRAAFEATTMLDGGA